MKKLLPFFVVLALYFTPLYPVFAQADVFEVTSVKESTKTTTIKDRVKAKKGEVREKVASRTAALKNRLKQFRDKKIAAVVEKVNDGLAFVNNKRTDLMLKHLNKMTEIILKVEERVNKLSTSGRDVTAAQDAIVKAKDSISSAEEAAKLQAEKEYAVEVSKEANAKEDTKKTRDLLKSDLVSVQQKVADARKAVSVAITEAAKAAGSSTTNQGGNK